MKNSSKIFIGGIAIVVVIGTVAMLNTALQKGALVYQRNDVKPKLSEIFPGGTISKIAKPDLIISKIERTSKEIATSVYMVTVKNQGNISSGSFTISIFGSKEIDPLRRRFMLGSTGRNPLRRDSSIPDIGPGQEEILTFTLPTSDPPLKSVVSFADLANAVTESNDKNNFLVYVLPD